MSRTRGGFSPRISRVLREHCKLLTLSFFVGFGLSACSDSDEPEEPVQGEQAQAQSQSEDGAKAEATAEQPAAATQQGEAAEPAEVAEAEAKAQAAEPTDEANLNEGSESAPMPAAVAAASEGESDAPALPDEAASPTAASDLLANSGMSQPAVVEKAAMPEPTPAPVMPAAKPAKHGGGHKWEASQSHVKTPASGDGHYVVQVGDTLGDISRKIYGNGSHWQTLASLNNIQHPFMIFPGDDIACEATNSESESFVDKYKSVPELTVTVHRGDTLSGIARKIYGDPTAWKQLMAYNHDKIQNPHRIAAGMTLSYLDPQVLAQVISGIVQHPVAFKPHKVEKKETATSHPKPTPKAEEAVKPAAVAPAADKETAAAPDEAAPAAEDTAAAKDTEPAAKADKPAVANEAQPDPEFEEDAAPDAAAAE